MARESKGDLIQRSVRLPSSMWARIDAHARRMETRAAGAGVHIKVSDNQAVVDLLTVALRESEAAEAASTAGEPARGTSKPSLSKPSSTPAAKSPKR